MKILHNQSLKPFNTFHVEALADTLVILESPEEASSYLADVQLTANNILVLGGGSNILFTGNYDGVILKYEGKGISLVSEDEKQVSVRIAAGENWDGVVEKCMQNGWHGLENLSLIPGDTGAAPVQNIGAYGVELAERVVQVETVHIGTGSPQVFSSGECRFGYRDSIFKNEEKGKHLIVAVTLRLDKQFAPVLSYAVLAERLQGIPEIQITSGIVRNTVIDIRSSKLPDPKQIGNAGSFFKNPLVDNSTFLAIREKYPDIVSFPQEDGMMKLAAGWLIEKCGMKGFRSGDAGVHDKQSLVLVNHGSASGIEILHLSRLIAGRVKKTFGIDLQPEVNIH